MIIEKIMISIYNANGRVAAEAFLDDLLLKSFPAVAMSFLYATKL
jgi:hypothetical protein